MALNSMISDLPVKAHFMESILKFLSPIAGILNYCSFLLSRKCHHILLLWVVHNPAFPILIQWFFNSVKIHISKYASESSLNWLKMRFIQYMEFIFYRLLILLDIGRPGRDPWVQVLLSSMSKGEMPPWGLPMPAASPSRGILRNGGATHSFYKQQNAF